LSKYNIQLIDLRRIKGLCTDTPKTLKRQISTAFSLFFDKKGIFLIHACRLVPQVACDARGRRYLASKGAIKGELGSHVGRLENFI
jgi:hypothetical protein